LRIKKKKFFFHVLKPSELMGYGAQKKKSC